jgi:hypothetical protein
MTNRLVDLAFALVLFVGSISLWFVADSFPAFERYRNVDSDFWPKIVLSATALLSLILIVQNLALFRRPPAAHSDSAAPPAPPPNWGRLLFTSALVLGYFLALSQIGFVVSTMVFLAIATNVLPYSNLWVKLAFPFVFTAALTLFFTRVLSLPLPRGTGWFYELSLVIY